ncbi:MAG: hypothetical protein M1331_03805 [Candidatus Marsarchaeota archaeon]|nr:hypothetical protein [Candidatus Marsarchaeota archaeon]MCL5106492.1 hypothetical protein [Candidatus Marsarchaeota archaeon]
MPDHEDADINSEIRKGKKRVDYAINKEKKSIETEIEKQKNRLDREYENVAKEILDLNKKTEQFEGKLQETDEKFKTGKNESTGSVGIVGALNGLGHNKYFIIGVAILILIIGIYLRMGMFKYPGFFEPDAFFHFSVLQQAVSNHFIEPLNSTYSGFPAAHYIEEPDGLYYVTLIPYFFVRFFGVTLYSLTRLIPVLFGIMDIIGSFFLIRFLSKNNYLSLLAMFFVAVSNGDIARTAALVYRGDGFITIFMIVSLILMLKTFELKGTKKYISAISSGIILGIGMAVWNGSPFTMLVYILALIFILIYSFLIANKEYLFDIVLLSIAFLISHIIENLFYALTIIRVSLPFTDFHFFFLFTPVFLFSILAFFMLKEKKPGVFVRNLKARTLFVGIALAFTALVLLLFFYNYMILLSTGYGSISRSSSALAATIQELQPPTYQFLFASFYYALYLAPIGIVMFIGVFAFVKIHNHLKYKKISFAELVDKNYSTTLLGFLALLAYFAVTGYLQSVAIRFNSLVSIPFAIFSAFAVYLASLFVYKAIRHVAKTNQALKYGLFFAYLAVIFVFLFLFAKFSHLQAYSSQQADDINPSFLNAMSWMQNNTPSNATVLALWPDGSVIEGAAHRRSLMDSVSGQIAAPTFRFASFLFNSSNDYNYLYSINRPQYLVVRYFWFYELGGIAQEAYLNLTTNSQRGNYSYIMMNSLNITHNATAIDYLFRSNSFNVSFITEPSQNGTKFTAYVLEPHYAPQPIKNILFYNETSKNYSIATSSGNALNYTLLIYYSGRNIDGSALIGPKLMNSNMIKFLLLCNYAECPYNSGNVTLNLVYANNDTRIYKINYLNAPATINSST